MFDLCSHYEDIYDWISPFNNLLDWWFLLTQLQSMVDNVYGKSGHLSKTLIACRAMKLKLCLY